MSNSPLALVADDQHFGQAIHALLQERLCHPTPLRSFEEARQHLGPYSGGLLVCVATSGKDISQLMHLVQEVCLRRWPATVLVVEAGEAALNSPLACLDPYVIGRLRWPEEATGLLRFLRRSGEAGAGPGGEEAPLATPPSSTGEAIHRKLLPHTPSLAAIANSLALAATHDITVLLTGETGTGKTHLARLIHNCSRRHAEPLLVVPCGALSTGLLESELFGHAKGAFTGAAGPKVGKFEAAGRGTLLLDEIDTLELGAQAALLRILETGEFEPVGSNETRCCKARIIAASNWDLEHAVREGKFREDLYYRLSVLSFYLPPLRERVRDIEPLVRDLVARSAPRFDKQLFTISPGVLAALEAFPWPGNIRQLENAVQYAVLHSCGPVLQPEHLPELVRGGGQVPGSGGGVPLPRSREDYERNVIQRALAEADNCRSRAARALCISRGTLYNKMRMYGLHPTPTGQGRRKGGKTPSGKRLSPPPL